MHTKTTDWIDLRQAELVYPVSRRTFWKWITEGRLPAYRPFGRKVLLRRSEVEKILAATRIGTDLDKIVADTLQDLSTR